MSFITENWREEKRAGPTSMPTGAGASPPRVTLVNK